MTTPTDDPKVKELLEICRGACEYEWISSGSGGRGMPPWYPSMKALLRAFDPPKPKQYVLPSWADFTQRYINAFGVDGGTAFVALNMDGERITSHQYNAIREATAKD